jgi:hypothetical protein
MTSRLPIALALVATVACGDDTGGAVDTGTTSSSSSTGEESTSTGEQTGTETGDSSTTGPMPCVGNEDCTDVAAPLCEPVSGECVACDAFGDEGDAACAGLDPLAPLCVGGRCVVCTPDNPVVCDDQLLLCDGGSNSCVPCTEHAQCGSGACELAVGRCFPDDFVVTVDGDGPADYPTIAAAVAAVGDGMHGVIVVHELDAGDIYGPVTITNGKTIALLAAPGEAPIVQGTGGNPGLRVEGPGTILYMDGLRLRNGDVQGLVVDGAFAWVDRSRIVQNTGGGVLAQNGAELTLRNCFVGGDISDRTALEVDGATASVIYSTLGSGTFNASALTCTTPVAVDVRNSVLVTRGGSPPDEVACAAANITYSATEGAVAGVGNVAVGMFPGASPGDWFVDYTTGNFRLQNQGLTVFANIARWTAGDPRTDIDGDARPSVDGTPDFAGADVP